jgi:hypothetical protein
MDAEAWSGGMNERERIELKGMAAQQSGPNHFLNTILEFQGDPWLHLFGPDILLLDSFPCR